MKPMKVAAVVAGSLVAAFAAAPAFAADLAPSSLNGALDTVTTQSSAAAGSLANERLDTEQKGSLLHTANGAAGDLNDAGKLGPKGLLGGLPVGA
ncbi:hypothetical protein [Streptomyces sp. NPDC002133]|uniref:hypothetical protein n=1 Tax=Streptomyces sp. NPDC002133 TaxID=3154409 RepID=UPI003320E6E3